MGKAGDAIKMMRETCRKCAAPVRPQFHSVCPFCGAHDPLLLGRWITALIVLVLGGAIAASLLYSSIGTP